VISGIPLRAPSDLPEGVHLEVPVPFATDELPAIVERLVEVARSHDASGCAIKRS
jgi:dimethylglycine catabolism A